VGHFAIFEFLNVSISYERGAVYRTSCQYQPHELGITYLVNLQYVISTSRYCTVLFQLGLTETWKYFTTFLACGQVIYLFYRFFFKLVLGCAFVIVLLLFLCFFNVAC
jgi:hypothetical protein